MNPLSIRRDGEIAAQLMWEVCEGVTGLPGRTGIVGHYSANDFEAGVELLRRAQRLCHDEGADRIIGPMNGSTWHPYRLALLDETGHPDDARPPFPLEPNNPPEFVPQFEAAGFRPAAYYQSRLVEDLSTARPGAAALSARVAGRGITVSPLERAEADSTLAEVWPLCREAFSPAPFYRPIEFEEFRGLYRGVIGRLPLDLILVARSDEGRLLSFVLAYPDMAANLIILKTLAVAPGCGVWGVGTHLADEIHRLAREQGYTGVIHALMNEGNASMNISLKFRSVPFRRYALYQWTP